MQIMCNDNGFVMDLGDHKSASSNGVDCLNEGFTPDEINQAASHPGTWIECPRPRTKDEAIEVVTAERNALLEACGKMAAFLRGLNLSCGCGQCDTCDAASQADRVLALVEKSRAIERGATIGAPPPKGYS